MFNSRRSFSSNRFRGGGHAPQRGSFSGRGRPAFGRGRQSSFDPSQMIRNTSFKPMEKVEYVAENKFNDLKIAVRLKQNIIKRGYQEMTPIQDQAIFLILAGKDVVGVAKTGTGKTAAFLIPLINKMILNPQEKGLVITPTRELAVQIQTEFKLLTVGLNLWSGLIIGGAGMGRQIDELKRRPNLVVGTPGRLMDLERRRKIYFSDYKTIILDEVDRMLDMGFIKDIQEVIGKLPSVRQSLFFSATIPAKAREVMSQFLTDPVTVSVEQHETKAWIHEEVVKLNGRPKAQVLHDLLIKPGFDKVLVFGRTKWGMEKLGKELRDRGFLVASIHGNKTQHQRQQALQQFKDKKVKVLLATDLASRGLDIDNVTHVINYDLPSTREDYIHRIGRTGRADKKGIALTLVD